MPSNEQFKQLYQQVAKLNQIVAFQKRKYEEFIKACENTPKSVTQEIDSIPGRRLYYNLSDRLAFDINNDGQRGQPLNFLVSQDGPFIQTHYPLVTWKPTLPTNADNFGQWQPISSWPLPTQEQTNQDRINISWETSDSGSQRNFQNEPTGPGLSRPDNLIPLPVPTLFAPNTTIQFTPTFEDILFNAAATVDTTQGELSVSLYGYRIANL